MLDMTANIVDLIHHHEEWVQPFCFSLLTMHSCSLISLTTNPFLMISSQNQSQAGDYSLSSDARYRKVSSPMSSDWLHACPVANICSISRCYERFSDMIPEKERRKIANQSAFNKKAADICHRKTTPHTCCQRKGRGRPRNDSMLVDISLETVSVVTISF
jgi:hypothetical protein